MTQHLLVAISSHGFGHLSQVAPVVNRLWQQASENQHANLALRLRTTLAEPQIRTRVFADFALDTGSDDFGMLMHDALRVNLTETLIRYAQWHQDWSEHVDQLAEHLSKFKIHAVLADAPYLPLAAAHAINIPAAGICSLNWADILEGCVQFTPGALSEAGLSLATFDAIIRQMRDAYQSARVIIRPEPAIETTDLTVQTIEPIVEPLPSSNRQQLLASVRQTMLESSGLDHRDYWLILTSMGGISMPLQTEYWPTEILGRPVAYIVDRRLAGTHAHCVSLNPETFSFQEVIASCDLVLTKPGYGMFVEAKAAGKPLLYLRRDHWPETPCLVRWAKQNLIARELTPAVLATGQFAAELRDLLSVPPPDRYAFEGARQAAEIVTQNLLG